MTLAYKYRMYPTKEQATTLASFFGCTRLLYNELLSWWKTCNRCGEKNDGLKLSDRRWICPHCGAEIDRDYNAACNLRDYFLKIYNTAGTAEINASGDNVRNVVALLQRSVSMKEEAAWSLAKR